MLKFVSRNFIVINYFICFPGGHAKPPPLPPPLPKQTSSKHTPPPPVAPPTAGAGDGKKLSLPLKEIKSLISKFSLPGTNIAIFEMLLKAFQVPPPHSVSSVQVGTFFWIFATICLSVLHYIYAYIYIYIFFFFTDKWGTWSNWASCSKTCGEGRRARSRECAGYNCTGPAVNKEACFLQDCPGTGNDILWLYVFCCLITKLLLKNNFKCIFSTIN